MIKESGCFPFFYVNNVVELQGMKKTRKIATIFIMCMILFVQAITVFAEPTTDEEIDEAKKEKEQTEEQLNSVNATIEDLSSEVSGIEEEMDEIDCALVQIMAEIKVVEDEISEKEVEIEDTEADYEAAVEKEKSQYDAMKIRIQYLYENGNDALLSVYLEAGSISEAITKADYIESLYAYDRKMLEEYKNTVAEVNALHEELLLEKDELVALQAEYEEEQDSLEVVMTELEAVANDYYSQIATARAEADAYSKQLKAQNKEIKRLEDKKRKEEEEARRKAEEEARKKAEEEARKNATDSMADSQRTGVITTTNNNTYDVSSIYSANGSDLGKSLAAFACQYIGNPYVPGGTSLTDGADCSGFVFAVYKSFGYKVPRTSSSLRSAGVEVAYADAQPGDVVCYPGHVGIYIGNGMIVHASTQKTGIKVSRADYRGILCVRRIL